MFPKHYEQTRIIEEQKQLERELEIQKYEDAEKEGRVQNEKREREKYKTQRDSEIYKREKQRKQDLKNEAKTPRGRMRKAQQEAFEIRKREEDMGLTEEEREFNHLDKKTQVDYRNARSQGEVRDIRGFLKQKRIKEENSRINRKRLKGF